MVVLIPLKMLLIGLDFMHTFSPFVFLHSPSTTFYQQVTDGLKPERVWFKGIFCHGTRPLCNISNLLFGRFHWHLQTSELVYLTFVLFVEIAFCWTCPRAMATMTGLFIKWTNGVSLLMINWKPAHLTLIFCKQNREASSGQWISSAFFTSWLWINFPRNHLNFFLLILIQP